MSSLDTWNSKTHVHDGSLQEPNPRPGAYFYHHHGRLCILIFAASCNALVGNALGSRTPNELSAYLAAKTAYEAWSVQCKQESVLPFQAYSSERPPKQQTIPALVHQKKSEGSAQLQIIQNSMKLPEAKTWVNCRPSSGYATYIPNHHIKVWPQFLCHVPLFEPGARCTRPQCAAVLDSYGDHLLYCERSSSRIRRHDAQVWLLVGDLAKAARHPIVEERPLGRHRERPYIRALGRTGGTDLFDVTIFHLLSQARIRDAKQNPLNILKAAWAGKVSRYEGMVHEAGRSAQLLPVPISTPGGWHPDAHRALCSWQPQ